MITPRRWSNFLFGAIVLGIGAGGVIAFALTYAFKDHESIYSNPGPTKAAISVVQPSE